MIASTRDAVVMGGLIVVTNQMKETAVSWHDTSPVKRYFGSQLFLCTMLLFVAVSFTELTCSFTGSNET